MASVLSVSRITNPSFSTDYSVLATCNDSDSDEEDDGFQRYGACPNPIRTKMFSNEVLSSEIS